VSASSAEPHRKIVNRLRRAEGQLGAVIATFEDGGSCRDVVTQLAAVTSALNRAGYAIVSEAMKDCLTDSQTAADAAEGLDAAKLEKLFLMLA